MANLALRTTVNLHVEHCYRCGTPFGIEDTAWTNMKERGDSFYCPWGHKLTTGEGSKTKQIRELEEKAERLERWNRSEREARERTERQLRGQKAATTRLKNRAKNGVCPCCNRTFSDLARHMKSKHPDFAA